MSIDFNFFVFFLLFSQYYSHKSIIYLTLKDETDLLIEKFKLNNLNDDLIELILYYCYSNCLPLMNNLNQANSDKYFQFIKQFKNFNNLECLLNTLFSNISFKKRE